MSIEDNIGNRVMMAAFEEELEKIALTKEMLLRAGNLAAKESTHIGKMSGKLRSKGYDSAYMIGAKDRRASQASRFLASAQGAQPPGVSGLRSAKRAAKYPALDQSAENLRRTKKVLHMPRVQQKVTPAVPEKITPALYD